VDFVGEVEEPGVSAADTPDDRVHNPMVDLNNFLGRPVKIFEKEWASSTVFSDEIDPWKELFDNPRISNRLNNYRLFKGKCHVKFLINGNGFFYGRLMCSYHPKFIYDSFTGATALIDEDFVQLSQMPTIYLDPTTSMGGTLELPFFCETDYVDLDDATSTDLGRIWLRELVELRHANNPSITVPQVSITVYAWFSDVELQAPTHENAPFLTAQSGREDETETKPVSQMATKVADAASLCANAPVIGKYASAVETGARMVSSVASSMGYCEPTNVKEPCKIVTRFSSNCSTVNTSDNSEKLTTDVKQEITVDPTTCGLPAVDQMSFAYIASRWSYFTKFTWARSDAPDKFLWNCRVSPNAYGYNATGNCIVPTSVCGLGIPFGFWTGSLVYKFVIVSSNFHRGRLAIQYDPHSSQNTLLDPREDNIAFTKIIDISETREFEITINNHNPYGYLPLEKNLFTPMQASSSTIYTSTLAEYNGTLSVYVQNVLTSPNPDAALSADIEIMMFIKGGDDLSFSRVDSLYSHLQLKPQSGTEVADSMNVAAPMQPTRDVVGNNIPAYNNQMYMGESITSFRTLAKRFSAYRNERTDTTSTSTLNFKLTHPMYPLHRGKMSVAVDTATPNTNYVLTTLMDYVSWAYQGVRGSCRWKIMALASDTGSYGIVSRLPLSTYSSSTGTSSITTQGFATNQNFSHLNNAFLLHDFNNNAVTEFEIPFYSEKKFIPGKVQNWNTITGIEGFGINYFNQSFGGVGNSRVVNLFLFPAGGEDYDCLFYVGWPRIYYSTTL